MMADACLCSVSYRLTEDRSRAIRKASQLVDKIRMLGGLAIKDRSYHLKNYKSCFIASELVEWLISSGEATDKKQAVELGQLLVNTDYIHHVVDEHNFEDSYLFFRFRQDEPPGYVLQGPSVAYMKGQEGALISLLAKKRAVLGWTYSTFVLSPSTSTLFEYRTELDSAPIHCYSLAGCLVQPEHPRPTTTRHILNLIKKDREKFLCLGADSSETQFTWLRVLQSMGLEILPATNEVEDQVRNAHSIFEFEAKDIDGNVVSLERYRGHVTLIVNVASQ